jgi:hypothetical protein
MQNRQLNQEVDTLDQLPTKKLDLKDLIIAFLFPTLIGKSLMLYFGLNYSNEPGEGYGVGLVLSILFTCAMAGRFIWKYRNYED